MAKAKEKGIDTAELNAVFERKLRRVTAEFCGGGGDGSESGNGNGNGGKGRSVAWRLAKAEEAVWEWFCRFLLSCSKGKGKEGRVREARRKGWGREREQSRQCGFKKKLS